MWVVRCEHATEVLVERSGADETRAQGIHSVLSGPPGWRGEGTGKSGKEDLSMLGGRTGRIGKEAVGSTEQGKNQAGLASCFASLVPAALQLSTQQ